MIDRATLIQRRTRSRRASSGRRSIARSSTRPPFLWLVNLTDVAFVSELVGNYQRHPQWGTLLDQLWVL